MSQEDQDFLIKRNIERFSGLLASEVDEQKRQTLKCLLREEQEKQADDGPEADARIRD